MLQLDLIWQLWNFYFLFFIFLLLSSYFPARFQLIVIVTVFQSFLCKNVYTKNVHYECFAVSFTGVIIFLWTLCKPFKGVLDWSEAIGGTCYVVGLAAGRKRRSEADEADVKAAGLLLTVQWSELWTHTSIWSLCTFTPYCLAPLRSDKLQHLATPPTYIWPFGCWLYEMMPEASYDTRPVTGVNSELQNLGWQVMIDVGLDMVCFFQPTKN